MILNALKDSPTDGPEYHLIRTCQVLSESRPGAGWSTVTHQFWPGWRDWFERHGGSRDPGQGALRAVRRHMPEFEGLIETLAEAHAADALLAEFLPFWCPPRYLTGCSQAATCDEKGPMLIRNYDLDPALNELTLYRTGWRGKAVIGMCEGLAGLSDGINEDGLAASITFGGRIQSGRGFGIPLILRYVLETCTDVADAIQALRAVPCHMSYNMTLTDRAGRIVTALLAPDRPPILLDQPWTTNHQIGVEWPRHGRMTRTIERAETLERAFATGQPGEAPLRALFARAPLYSSDYRIGFGTVFTALYRPEALSVELIFGNCSAGIWTPTMEPSDCFAVTYSPTGATFHQQTEIHARTS